MTSRSAAEDIPALMSRYRERVEAALQRCLEGAEHAGTPPGLMAAMRHGLFPGGKRLRPLLVYGVGHALGGAEAADGGTDAIACAVELMHSYSLIHDDLPAMDDSALRRGHPSCHAAYGESTALLAGSALQALAFEVLAGSERLEASRRVRLITILAQAADGHSLMGGQYLDLSREFAAAADAPALERMYGMKTGALMDAALHMGAVHEGAQPSTLERVRKFAHHVALAFQLRDDLLDLEADAKARARPGTPRPPTYPGLCGKAQTEKRLREHRDLAIQAVRPLRHGWVLEALAGSMSAYQL